MVQRRCRILCIACVTDTRHTHHLGNEREDGTRTGIQPVCNLCEGTYGQQMPRVQSDPRPRINWDPDIEKNDLIALVYKNYSDSRNDTPSDARAAKPTMIKGRAHVIIALYQR